MRMATDIVVAFLGSRSVDPAELPILVKKVRAALADDADEGGAVASALEGAATEKAAPAEPLTPAVPIEDSITPEFLISLEDGKPYRTLRRHLMAKYGMTPEAYRAKWNLPADYPMAAPGFAEARSQIAHRIGLGKAARAPGSGRKRSAAKV